jgi:hypothetical protein
MKTILFSFLLFTATVCLTTSVLAFLGVMKDRMKKGKTDDDMVTGFAASLFAWGAGLIFLYCAYLAY